METKGNSYEEEMDLSIGNAVGRQKQKRLRDRGVCACRAQCAARDLAIRR
jgi:hypothetical protein